MWISSVVCTWWGEPDSIKCYLTQLYISSILILGVFGGTVSKYLNYLIVIVPKFGVFLLKDHPEGSQGHKQTMTHIPKHYSKQERECNDGVNRWKGIEIKAKYM